MDKRQILPRHYSEVQIKKQYARVAWFYDAWSRLTEDRAQKRLLQLTRIENGSQILEVAVGTGRLFEKLVEQNAGGMNEGIDLSPSMLAYAKRRMLHCGQVGAYHLQQGSAYELPFTSDRFDLLFSTYMLDLLPAEDYPRLLGEFLRVLKPGGKLAIAYFAPGHHWANQVWPWLAEHFPGLLTGCRPVDLRPVLKQLGVEIIHHESISQNTFPSDIIIACKKQVRAS